MMKTTIRNFLVPVAMCGLLLAGCSDSDDDPVDVVATDPDPVDESVVEPVVEPEPEPVVEFAFATQTPDEYTRVDRAGMPAIATALIASDDDYNRADPVDDIDSANPFVAEILNSLTALHGALDDQLVGLGLTPCTVVGDGTGTCATTAVPLIIPDTLTLDTSTAAGFPNGRLLTDPVIAVTLAVALIELTGDPAPHTATALVGVVNPPANDLEFSPEFPFLAAPHQ